MLQLRKAFWHYSKLVTEMINALVQCWKWLCEWKKCSLFFISLNWQIVLFQKSAVTGKSKCSEVTTENFTQSGSLIGTDKCFTFLLLASRRSFNRMDPEKQQRCLLWVTFHLWLCKLDRAKWHHWMVTSQTARQTDWMKANVLQNKASV